MSNITHTLLFLVYLVLIPVNITLTLSSNVQKMSLSRKAEENYRTSAGYSIIGVDEAGILQRVTKYLKRWLRFRYVMLW